MVTPAPAPPTAAGLVPLPMPKPLQLADHPPADISPPLALAPDMQKTADRVVDMAANAAGRAIDALVSSVDRTPPDLRPVALPPAAVTSPSASPPATSAATDPQTVAKVQRGLASLGFLHGNIDGVAGEATAKAIRNFEVYYDYKVTGQITPDLLNLLAQNGAEI
jgi:hypothetical protein